MTDHTSGSLLLDDTGRFVRRFVVVSDVQRDALALWAVHTHAIAAFDTTPYLAITSAMWRSGKSRLLEVLELLVREPQPTGNISDAALFRLTAKEGLMPTLLFDEVDAIFGPKARDREDLRALLNAGYRRGAVARRMGGPRMTTLEAFPVFCPKAFAGIGQLPDTVTDRSVPVRLERRTREEAIERFRRRVVQEEGETLRDRAADWCDPRVDELRELWPALPDELDDRAQDCWEPLLAVADAAGADWPERARAAALALSGPDARRDDDDSLTGRLLLDLHHVFSDNGAVTRWRTADLIAELCKIEESPWGDWKGKPITAQALSRLLKPFRVMTMPVWVDGETVRGYKVEQFADAFLRVLGVRGVRGVKSRTATDAPTNTPNAPNAQHTGDGASERRPANVCDVCTTPAECAAEHSCRDIAARAGEKVDVERAKSESGHWRYEAGEAAREYRANDTWPETSEGAQQPWPETSEGPEEPDA